MTIDLKQAPTAPPASLQKEEIKEKTKALKKRLAELQKVLYAQQRFSLLVIFQGLDAAGKDGAIRKVFSGLNPLGVHVKAFKVPTEEERAHDFLWRVHPHVPAKGMIHIFNRSHYEDVLVPVVEGLIDEARTRRRYEFINCFEALLEEENETRLLKFFLHVSPAEQRRRLIERRNNPEKFWKHNDSDWEVAEKRDKYYRAYEQIFKHCSRVPWHLVPADKNWYKTYVVLSKVVETLEALPLRYPPLDTSNT
ncbi:PPK2 family polyphosphate kinase [Thermonema rossianum]|uniref:PPK2 family polyphosphate kinase n=1 Tax=Thermonema rossianum TaxID=55505 RepID=UPI00068E8EEC|nr:PPK2 family polyphosphate kinase [Thermonema rossianum]